MEKKLDNLLKLRKKIKSKKPDFVRQQYNQKKSLGKKWRKPKGIHSKLRLNKAGHMKKPSPGFSSPKKVRHLTLEGFKPRLVKNIAHLKTIKNNEIIILSSKLGLRKKLKLLEKIKELKLKVSNIKNIEEFITKSKERLKQKKQKSKEKEAKKQEEKTKAVKKAEEKKQEEEKSEEKKKKELTKKLIEKTEKKPQKTIESVITKQQIARPTAPKQK